MALPDPASCKNCGTSLTARYCPACGQDGRDPPVGFPALLQAAWDHLTGADGLAIRTLRELLFRPGRLTRAFVDGQRVRYAAPLRLYLWCTAGFFLLHAYAPFVRLDPESGLVHSTLSTLSLEIPLPAPALQQLADQGMSLAAFTPHFDAAVSAYLPFLLIALVLIMAGVFKVLAWRQPALMHGVFSLHWSSFYFALAIIRRGLSVLGNWGTAAATLGVLVALAWLVIALRTAYLLSWLGAAWRAIIAFLVFATLLGAWLWSTTELAAWLAAVGAF